MDVPVLRSFVAVSRLGGFCRAAEVLHLTQPGVSGHIHRLEEELGVTLFDRSARQPSLTTEGAAILPEAEAMIALHERILLIAADLQDKKRGEVRLACGATHAITRLPPVLRAYTQERVRMSLRLTIAASAAALRLLAARAVDLALVTTTYPYPDIAMEPLFVDNFVAVVPPNLTNNDFAGSLEEVGLIAFAPGSGLRRFTDEALVMHNLPTPEHITEIDSLEAARSLVEAGLGCAFLPKLVVEDAVAAGRVRVCALPSPALTRTTYLCMPTTGYMTQATHDLQQFLLQYKDA